MAIPFLETTLKNADGGFQATGLMFDPNAD
jgi:hypothetical protein